MATYYDSSVLVAFALGQVYPINLSDDWQNETIRVASILLKMECIIAIRRFSTSENLRTSSRVANRRLKALEPYFNGIHYMMVDESIETVIRVESKLAQCRSLDAIHLATALYLQSQMEESLKICSFDKRLRKTAMELNFTLIPEKLADV